MRIVPLAPKILACRELPGAHTSLLSAMGIDIDRYGSLGLLTCDQDDSLYVALDESTKHADVEVQFARSFYAGARHASGPLSGEALGIVGGADCDSVQEGLRAATRALEVDVCFYEPEGGGPAFFPHVIGETGRYLSAEAGIAEGEPMGYFIAPPLESAIAIDAALKCAEVHVLRYFPPPTETNFAGAYLGGKLHDLQAAARAFVSAVLDVAQNPLTGMKLPSHRRW